MEISGLKIGDAYKPFVIAELSANHQQSLENAKKLVLAAARAGVNAVKLQTYKPSTITLDCDLPDFVIGEPQSPWHGRKLFDLYREGMTPWEWHQELFQLAAEQGLIAFSSPFDETAVDFLETLDTPAYKIASFELTHHPLLKKIANTGKPVILSTGMATLQEITAALHVLRSNGAMEIAILKCTSTYPAKVERSNLLTIHDMINRFDVPVGLSDHTNGIGAAVAGVALGASLIEKHVCLDRHSGALDASFSATPDELAILVKEANNAWMARGEVSYGPTEDEVASLKYRRSIYFCRDLRAGDTVTPDTIVIVRPSFGLPPSDYESVLGRILSENVTAGMPLKESVLKPLS